MELDSYDVGDKVKHPKFGQGTVTLRQGEGDTQKLTIKFGGEVGEKKIMVKFGNMKKLQERPTLPAAPSAEAAAAPVATPGRAKLGADADDDADDEILEIEGDEDPELEDEDEAETDEDKE